MHAVKFLLDPPRVDPQSESVHDNVFWRGAMPRMSVCVMACGRDASPLLTSLSGSDQLALVEFVIFDDGRCSQDDLAKMQAAASHVRAAVRIVSSNAGHDGFGARGAAARHARTSWVLLLDAAAETDAGLIATHLETIARTEARRCGPPEAKAG